VRGGEVEGVAFGGDVEFGEGHEEEAAEGCAEEGAVDGLEAGVGGDVDVEAGGAEEFDGFLAGDVTAADGEDAGLVAEDPGAVAKGLQFVFVGHLLDSRAGGDEALVDEAVEELGGRFDGGEVTGQAHGSVVGGPPVGGGDFVAIFVAHGYVVVLFVFFFFLLVFEILVFILLWLDIENHL